MPRFSQANQVVGWLGAVQSQDYAGAKWSLAQSMRSTGDAALEDEFARGAILRTHMLRPTWHFVLPEDIRWMQALTSPAGTGARLSRAATARHTHPKVG